MTSCRRHVAVAAGAVACVLTGVGLMESSPFAAHAQRQVTFAKDVAPILQRSCQRCHRPGSVAPMSLITYDEVRPWARAITRETSGRRMPPWYIDRDVGIQKFRDDPSLSDREIATIAEWADGGAPSGNLADMPPPLTFPDGRAWTIGQPDLIVSSPAVTMEATAADWWGALGDVPTGLTEDRYISAIESLEVSDIRGSAIFHHAGFVALTADGQFEAGSIHEVGRNAERYDADAGMRIGAGGSISFNNAHAHATGEKTTARLVVGLTFHPVGYKPRHVMRGITLGNPDLDVRGNERNQVVEAFSTLQQPARLLNFEPHMHASGSRMCLEAIWGTVRQTLTCAGFDPRWMRNYAYDTDAAPLLPKGTILRLTAWLDTTPNPKNPYLVDYRNWTGWGSRPVDNMFMNYLNVVFLTPEQLKEEVATRLERARRGAGDLIGCLPCTLPYALDPSGAR